MPTVYSTSPYFDDFSDSKQFYRILFRAGRAVQSRELTQLQTILQGQIEKFGKGIYQEGSFVTPPKEVYDPNYNFVKLNESYNSVTADDILSLMVGKIIVGQTSGVRATIVNYTVSTTAGDPPTLYVKYLNAGNNGEYQVFENSEVLLTTDSVYSVQAISSSATGVGTAYSVGNCVVFAKGNFLYVDEQTSIIEKYTVATNKIIGFQITESVVEFDEDDSLLDPAIGSFNYFAPGADRYKVNLSLTTREFTVEASDDPNFVEVIRVQGGDVISRKIDPRFSVIGDTLARRTYDESGDYIVRPYKVELINHLRSGNSSADLSIARDGLFNADEGGNAQLFVSVISPGKAYVKGYEVENINSKFINLEKARDFVVVNNGVFGTQLSSYVNVCNAQGMPDITTIDSVDLYNQYNFQAGTPNGTKVGSAKIRGLEYVSGDFTANTHVHKLYLFDVSMEPNYTFERDVKQFHATNATTPDFTANLLPTTSILSGSINFFSGSDLITGNGTQFTSELRVGDYLTIGNVAVQVNTIYDDTNVEISSAATFTRLGSIGALNTASLNDSDKNTFIIKLPRYAIKSVDPESSETSYSVKRNYARTLDGSGLASITLGTDESFGPVNNEDYQIVINSGVKSGQYYEVNSSRVSRSGTNLETLNIDLSGDGFSSETIAVMTTVRKSNSAALRKNKTLIESSNVDYTSQSDAQSTELNLAKADIYRLRSVRESSSSFGSSFNHVGSNDITDRYTLDNGQKLTYYGIGKLKLNPGQPKPIGPVRITFDYFSHGSGDFFSVNSYSGIDYADIPSVTIDGEEYNLRDCLDFRPRLNDAGTSFSSTTEFIDPEVDFATDYEYYLPRTDKLVINTEGVIFQVKGVSSLEPKEPRTPDDCLALFVFKQKAYVFDVQRDIDVSVLDHRRYTMKDISKIDNRLKTVEYYTALNLLELQAQQLQIKDDFGFDKFKNGFLVDSFAGHGVGDSLNNLDFGASVDYSKREAGPRSKPYPVKLRQLSTTAAQKTSNSYSQVGSIITLPFTEEIFAQNNQASKTENLNPFNVVSFNGLVTLDPPVDLWFDEQQAPQILVDDNGDYDSLLSYASAKREEASFYTSVRDIEQFRSGLPSEIKTPTVDKDYIDQLTVSSQPSNTTLTQTGNDIIINSSVIPLMRDVSIKFTANALKPNTRIYVYFDGENVTDYCKKLSASELDSSVTVEDAVNDVIESQTATTLVTSSTGSFTGTFNYTASTLKFTTGKKSFRISDSPINDKGNETTSAEAIFDSSGLLVETSEIALIRPTPKVEEPPKATSTTVNNSSSITVAKPQPAKCTSAICALYRFGLGREGDAGGIQYWTSEATKLGAISLEIAEPSWLSSSTGRTLAKNFFGAAVSNNEHLNSGGLLAVGYRNIVATLGNTQPDKYEIANAVATSFCNSAKLGAFTGK